jgi:hypothetical protein
LALSDCKSLIELPNNLEVGGRLFLEYSSIEELPLGLKVGGLITYYDTPLEKNKLQST